MRLNFQGGLKGAVYFYLTRYGDCCIVYFFSLYLLLELKVKNKKQIGKALGRVPSGLFVVTAKFEDKEDAVLASWVNQCSFDPPGVTVSLGQMRNARLLIESSQAFIVNILGKESSNLMKHFFKSHEGSIFDGLKTRKGIEGIKILTDILL